MCIIMHGENHFTYWNNGPMVKDFFFKHGSEGRWKVQTFTFAPQADGLGKLGSHNQTFTFTP
jgi:hypothetical protein